MGPLELAESGIVAGRPRLPCIAAGTRNEDVGTNEDEDLRVISAALDGDGKPTDGRKPMENPADASRAPSDDPLLEPRPDEPGVSSNGDSGPAENPGEEPSS